jgi:predicted nucleotide-binding protein
LNRDDVVALLHGNGFEIRDEKRLSNETGWQLRLASGQVVNVYDKGTVQVQGKDTGRVRELLGLNAAPAAVEHVGATGAGGGARNVFVVYGQTIIEKLESVRTQASFAVVLATPDDEGHRAGRDEEKKYRARQNVVLELGMMLTILGRSRVAILLKNQKNMERPSDIDGLIYIPFEDDLEDAKVLLAKEINEQGIRIDLGRL